MIIAKTFRNIALRKIWSSLYLSLSVVWTAHGWRRSRFPKIRGSMSVFVGAIGTSPFGEKMLMNGSRRDGYPPSLNLLLVLGFQESIRICKWKSRSGVNGLLIRLLITGWLSWEVEDHACTLYLFPYSPLALPNSIFIHSFRSGFKFSQLEMSTRLHSS